MVGDVAVGLLLAAGVALQVMSIAGVLAMRSVYDRLHFTGPATLAVPCFAAAILVREGFSLVANKALFVAAFMLVTSPVTVHFTARAARIAERGDWEIEPADRLEIEG